MLVYVNVIFQNKLFLQKSFFWVVSSLKDKVYLGIKNWVTCIGAAATVEYSKRLVGAAEGFMGTGVQK